MQAIASEAPCRFITLSIAFKKGTTSLMTTDMVFAASTNAKTAKHRDTNTSSGMSIDDIDGRPQDLVPFCASFEFFGVWVDDNMTKKSRASCKSLITPGAGNTKYFDKIPSILLARYLARITFFSRISMGTLSLPPKKSFA
uniref:CSON011087 protein n=1 Tax=Culicoides sonorensis TaxID=179676 RepID=A0A336LYY6_CULSO